MARIRSGDEVMVLTGGYAKKVGKVLAVISDKLVVEGVNIKKKSVKKRSPESPSFVEFPAPIHASNVRVCVDGVPVKLRVRFLDGRKELFFIGADGEEKLFRVLSSNKRNIKEN